ncbi:MAG: alpha/beta hydrolase [Fimbriimonadaceae bacterium]
MLSVLISLLAVPAETEVTFVGHGGLQLRGSLMMPERRASLLPAVLLLPGSGPTDRDGNQMPTLITDLLKQTAERLAKEGYASLRFDKRATPGYARTWPTDVKEQNDFFSFERFVGDAKCALLYLQKQPGVNNRQLVIAGHSEGSIIASEVARELKGQVGAPTGLILMGAPGRTLDFLVKEQVAASLKRNAVPEATAKTYNDYVDLAIKEVLEKGTVPPNPPVGLGGLFPPSAIRLLKSYFTLDPSKSVSGFEGPVLVVQGQKDIQVSLERDTPILEKALKARAKGATEVFAVPSASHNLKEVSDENKEPGMTGPVVPSALDAIANWMKKQFPIGG